MYAKKSLGQHFLKSESALSRIVQAGEVKRGDVVLEIGPGTGALTKKLLETGAEVLAVEKDDALYERLQETFEQEIESGQLKLVNEDILNFKSDGFNKLVANIPYNITGAILKKFLGAEHQPERVVLLVQKEVAKRIVAQDEKESILSISVKVYGEPRYIDTVKAGSFAPAPKVDSAILAINNISKSFFSTISEEKFFKLLHAGFKSKRKKLSSNLATILDKDTVSETFSKLNLSENTRAEDINVEIWQKIAEQVG